MNFYNAVGVMLTSASYSDGSFFQFLEVEYTKDVLLCRLVSVGFSHLAFVGSDVLRSSSSTFFSSKLILRLTQEVMFILLRSIIKLIL